MNRNPSPQEVINRLRVVVGVKSERELSLHFGYGPTTMTGKRQRGSVPYEECVRVALETGISLDWLILGEGPHPDLRPGYQNKLEVREDNNAFLYGSLRPGDNDEFVSVPLYDIQAAAGTGRVFSEDRIKYHLNFRRDWLANEGLHVKDLVAAEVAGDSMEETLHDRDTVLINCARRSGDGVFVLRMGDAIRIKRVQRLVGGGLRLSSDNEMYATEEIHPEQLTDPSAFEILGHCHWRAGKIF